MKTQLGSPEDAKLWHLTSRAAQQYERWLVPVLFQPWAIDLVTRCGATAGSRVLDLACGTGAVTRAAVPRLGPDGEIIGLDLSEAMLAVARRQVPSDVRIQWRRGDAGSLPFPGNSFDAVLCQQGFQFFPERQRVLREIARVLRAGGRLALSVWCGQDRNPLGAALTSVIGKCLGPIYGEIVRQPFSLANPDHLEADITAARFRVISSEMVTHDLHAPDAAAFLSGEVCALPFDMARSDLRFGELVKGLLDCLRPYTHEDGSLELPFEAHTIVAECTVS